MGKMVLIAILSFLSRSIVDLAPGLEIAMITKAPIQSEKLFMSGLEPNIVCKDLFH